MGSRTPSRAREMVLGADLSIFTFIYPLDMPVGLLPMQWVKGDLDLVRFL